MMLRCPSLESGGTSRPQARYLHVAAGRGGCDRGCSSITNEMLLGCGSSGDDTNLILGSIQNFSILYPNCSITILPMSIHIGVDEITGRVLMSPSNNIIVLHVSSKHIPSILNESLEVVKATLTPVFGCFFLGLKTLVFTCKLVRTSGIWAVNLCWRSASSGCVLRNLGGCG